MELIKQFRKLLNSADKKLYSQLRILVPLTVVSSTLEALSVGLILPLISVLLNPNQMNEYLSKLGYSEAFNGNDPTIFIATIVGFAFSMKAAVNLYAISKQNEFAFELQKGLSIRLINKYIRMEQQAIASKNSSTIIASAVNEVNIISQHFVLPSLILVGEIFVVILICALVFAIDPKISILGLLIFSVPSYAFYKIYSPKNMRYGQERQELEGKKILAVQEIVSLRVTIIVNGLSSFFEERFNKINELHADSTKKQFVIQQYPRVLLELVAIISIIIIVIIMVISERTGETIVPVLGLFAAAAFRLLPSVSKILWANQNIKYSTHFIDSVLTITKESEFYIGEKGKNKIDKMSEIDFRNVNFKYNNKFENSLNNININIKKGEFVGIMGESGSGKSTLLSLLIGFLKPAQGSILIDGIEIKDLYYWNLVGYVPQDVKLIDDSIENNIKLGLEIDDKNNALLNEAIEKSQLNKFINELPDGVQTNVGENGSKISGGQRQRIGLARALYRKPQLLILDEATNSLDQGTERDVINTLLALNGSITILMITHNQSIAQYMDKCFKVENGAVYEKK